MKLFYRFVFVVFLIVLFGCQQQQSALTVVEKEVIEKEVKEQFNQFVSAVNQKNADAVLEFYSKDEFISTIGGTDYFATRSAWADLITNLFSMRERQIFESLEVRVNVLTPNLALMTTEENGQVWPMSGEYEKFRHVFTILWKNEQAGWKIVHSHESWTNE